MQGQQEGRVGLSPPSGISVGVQEATQRHISSGTRHLWELLLEHLGTIVNLGSSVCRCQAREQLQGSSGAGARGPGGGVPAQT